MTTTEIISTEYIKPSSPTPQHLKTFNLSVLHQLLPAPYAPINFFYPNQDRASEPEVIERLEPLKKSLSQTLTRYYPLAGTIKDDLSIDCDDSGAHYATARVDTSLVEFMQHLDHGLINKFLPSGACVTNVQVNIFKCGGVVVSLCISHKILDGTALATFAKCWASLHRAIRTSTSDEQVVYPDLTTCFVPATDTRLKDSSLGMWGSLIKFGKCSTSRFVFDGSAIARLKTEAARDGVQHPTRVEVVSALLWKCFMVASGEKHAFLLSHVVNLRKRSGTMLSDNSIGNLVWLASTRYCESMSDIKLHELVNKVRGSILEIDEDFVSSLLGEKGPQVMEESLKLMKDCGKNEDVDYLGFTSWCKMGFYDVDFGWGKPIWVCGYVFHDSHVFTNFVVLMDTRDGDGIEAWVVMDEHKMRVLRHDPELLAFASIDPSLLQVCEVDSN